MSNLTLLDRLLDQSTTTESKEHVLEQMHYAMEKVEEKSLSRFEELVQQISADLGSAPEFNANCDASDGSKNPMPSWVVSGKQPTNATLKIMRLCYWRRELGVSFLILRKELDSKDRPKYFDLVLGGRRRTRTNTQEMSKMRHTDQTFMGWIKRKIAGDNQESPDKPQK